MYVNKLDDIVNKYISTYHKTTKPIDFNSSTYINFEVVSNDQDPKLKAGDRVRTSKCENAFAKENAPNSLEKVLVIKKVKNPVTWTYVIQDLNREEIAGMFY